VHAFFDESGKFHDHDFICIAGYIAEDPNWDAFCKQWQSLLKKHRLQTIHMTDLMALKGEYKGLGWSEENKVSVVKDFIGAIRDNVLAGFAVGLDAKYYRSMMKETKKRFQPQVFCFARLIKLLMNRLNAWGWTEPISSVFDDCRQYSMKCYSALCDIKEKHGEVRKLIASITFADDEVFYPLQAADLLAYATRQEQRMGDGAWSEGSIFYDLLREEKSGYGILYESEYWDGPELDRVEKAYMADLEAIIAMTSRDARGN